MPNMLQAIFESFRFSELFLIAAGALCFFQGLQWNGAIKLFDELIKRKKEPDGMSFATCITANGNASFWQRSLGLFHQMQRKMKADLVSFTSIIHACTLELSINRGVCLRS